MACIKLNFNLDVNKCLSELKAMLRLGRPKSDIEKLKKEMARLRSKRDDIKNQINEAEREGKIFTNEVSQWLREVLILEGKVAHIEQDFQSMSCFSCNCFIRTGGRSSRGKEAFAANLEDKENAPSQTQQARDDVPIGEPSNCCSIIRRVAKKLDEANELMSQAGALDPIAIVGSPKPSMMFPISHRLPVGIESYAPSSVESSNCCSIIRRVAKKLDEANELMSQAGVLDPIAIVGSPKPSMMFPISHRLPVGIESYVEDIVGYINGDEGNIIGIYGMAGVGKTTVLKSIQQYYLLNHTIFDFVIWVVASKDCQLRKLQMDIAKSLNLLMLQENDDEQTCGDKLFRFLKNRNCLLLLDDIWEHVDFQLLGMAHSATTERGHQQPHKIVVFTTRSDIVCAQMKAQKKMKVKCLDSDRGWQLFEQNSDWDVLSSDGGIKFVAKELAKECAGLPLALITIARAMLGKKSWEAWNGALHQIRDEHLWINVCLSEEESVVMYKAFKLSYDSLANDSIRECLLCCALWPEDYEINIFNELIPCWIGCTIIHEFNVINEAFTQGFSHLEALMAASLLEQCSDKGFSYSDTSVKMHDVIRDMALLMASGSEGNKRKWIVKVGIGLSDLPRQEEWQEAERASFMTNKITSLQDYGASTFSKLSILFIHNNFYLMTIPPSLFASMPRLTYLDLSRCDITELPMEIGSLTELQYLNFSSNPITRLPAEFGCLGKLEYLLLRNTNLQTVPNGTISNLSVLKWLDIREIPLVPEWWWDELKYFKGRHQLSVGININATTDNIERLKMLPNVSIWKLIINGKNVSELASLDLSNSQWSFNVSKNLESLSIINVAVDKLTLTAGVGRNSSFECLKILYFYELQLLEKISLNGVVLRNLRELYIHGCPMMKDVSWALLLPCLSILDISDCQKMKKLISEETGNSNPISSSNIQRLTLSLMKNLNRIANGPLHFPYLEYVLVMLCPGLKKLPFGAEILKNRLKKIEGEKDWWNNLDWDDERNKDSLTPYFRSYFDYGV